jgi:hypothetical protein
MLCKQNTKSQASLRSVIIYKRDIFVASFTPSDQIITRANAPEAEVESVSVVRHVEYLTELSWVCLARKSAHVLWLKGHIRQLFQWASKLRHPTP